MLKLSLTDALRRAAERCVWFEPAEASLAHPARLAAYIFTYGNLEDVRALRAQITQSDLRSLIDDAPPGIYDARSWAYWNLMIDRYDAPPMPQRTFSAPTV
jgi:hypothetical protein